MSLANIQGKLSRNEMKSIMAGSGAGKPKCDCNSKDTCSSGQICGSDCDKSGTSYQGHCTTQ